MNHPAYNNTISVDCVVFGFDGNALHLLLTKSQLHPSAAEAQEYKLPGSMILQDETLPNAAYRVLEEQIGSKSRDIFLKQLNVFSDPGRLDEEELQRIRSFYHIETRRVVTIAYYALVKLNKTARTFSARKGSEWIDVQEIRTLSLDHKAIVMEALSMFAREITSSASAFELLPRKFTIRMLQNLYEAVLGVEMDSRNFRKKMLGSEYLIPTEEREQHVAHKPARYYLFNKSKYERDRRSKLSLKWMV